MSSQKLIIPEQLRPWIKSLSFSIKVKPPAATYYESGEVLVHPDRWNELDSDQRFYVLAHEAGHIAMKNYQGGSELEADEFAFDQYVKSGRSLKAVIEVSANELDVDNSKQHNRRLFIQMKRAIQHDVEHNGNESLKHLAGKELTEEQFTELMRTHPLPETSTHNTDLALIVVAIIVLLIIILA